jgi:tetratricopeptide (TPR) repeat protein
MAGRFKSALPFYRKAERLYGRIGDRVSYAYTLWSLGTTYKMLGRYTEATRSFQKADLLFHATGDTRGRIYTLLGFAEIEFLKANQHPTQRHEDAKKVVGRGATEEPFAAGKRLNDHRGRDGSRRYTLQGNRHWKKAKAIADRSDYAWENLHVESLKDGKMTPMKDRYLKAGSKFYPKTVPINWP